MLSLGRTYPDPREGLFNMSALLWNHGYWQNSIQMACLCSFLSDRSSFSMGELKIGYWQITKMIMKNPLQFFGFFFFLEVWENNIWFVIWKAQIYASFHFLWIIGFLGSFRDLSLYSNFALLGEECWRISLIYGITQKLHSLGYNILGTFFCCIVNTLF